MKLSPRDLQEPKHDTQNWLTANNNNGQNYDVMIIRLHADY